MSGKKSRAHRRSLRARPAYMANAETARQSARAVLAVDFEAAALTRVTQFFLGWCRAAFAQSLVIADLTAHNMASAAAPNRRLFEELAVRLHWLHDLKAEDRPGAVDAMLNQDRDNVEKTHKHMADMGWEGKSDFAQMRDFVLNVIDDGRIRNQAKKFTAAAFATETKNVGLFGAWRDESSYAHATGLLAGSYAPADGTPRVLATPPVPDADLEGHRFTQLFIVALTYRMLIQERAMEHVAKALIDAFFGVQ